MPKRLGEDSIILHPTPFSVLKSVYPGIANGLVFTMEFVHDGKENATDKKKQPLQLPGWKDIKTKTALDAELSCI